MREKSNEIKGYLFAFLATLALSNVYIFGKAALNNSNLYTFSVYWFGFALLFNLIYSLYTGEFKKIRNLYKTNFKILFLIGIVEVIATGSFFYAIDVIENPTIPSFLRNMEPIFIVLISIFFLNERFSGKEKIGIILTIIGALVLSLKGKAQIHDIFLYGVQYILIATLAYAIRTVLVKKVIHRIDPVIVNFNKLFFLFVIFNILNATIIKSYEINTFALINISVGALLGPFLTSLFHYMSLKYITAAKTTLLQSATGLLVLFEAYLYFGSFPLMHQIIGGVVTIIGLIFLLNRSL